MALLTRRNAEVPEGAVVLTEEEALAHQKALIQGWPRETDVLFLKYSSYASFGATAASSTIILRHFTQLVGVKKNFLPFLLPSIFVPSFVAALGTEKLLTDNTLLMKLNCPLCHQMKFGVMLAYSGIAVPTLFGVTAHVALSDMIRKFAPKGNIVFWKEVFKVLKTGGRTYQYAGLVQIITTLLLPYMQARELVNVTDILKQDEELLDS